MCDWAVNTTKVQGPGLSIKFLAVVWSGNTKVVLEVVTVKIQGYLGPAMAAQVQIYVDLLGYSWDFTPHWPKFVLPCMSW